MASGKTRQQRLIDVPTPQTGQSIALTQAVETIGPIGRPTAAPTNLVVVATRELRSAVTPAAAIDITWFPPIGTVVTVYLIQWAKDAGFTVGLRQAETNARSATLDADTGTQYWIRVLARSGGGDSAWSNVVTTTTPQDTSPPAAPTALSTAWNGRTGDLLVTWSNPVSENFRDVRVRVYDFNGGVLWSEAFSTVGRYTWTLAANLIATSGSPDPSVYLELTSRSWSGFFSLTSLTGTATLAVPVNITGASVNFGGPDAVWTWDAVSTAAWYELTIDGVARRVDDRRYVYAFRQNETEHAGVADPSLTWSLVAVDALGQVSVTPASGVAVNPVPATTTISLLAGFNTLAVTIGAVTDADFGSYRVRLYLGGVLQDTLQTTQTLFMYDIDNAGSWTADVAVVDVFGQISTVTTSAAVIIDDFVTLSRLRADVFYRDSSGSEDQTIGAILRDDDFDGPGQVSYPANQWNWTQAERPYQYRLRLIPFSFSSGNELVYLGVSNDALNWTWYYGGSFSGNDWTPTSTTTNEATAQAGAVDSGVGGVAKRIILNGFVQTRYVRLGHRNTIAYSAYEFYPRRLIQTDDLEAESVTALKIAAGAIVTDKLAALAVTAAKIAAGAITADKINVSQLSAISADMGSLTAGTITGALIRSAASGLRWEGDSAGLRTYNASDVLQVEIATATDAGISVNGGNVRLNADGLSITTATTVGSAQRLDFIDHLGRSSGLSGFLFMEDEAGRRFGQLKVRDPSVATVDAELELRVDSSRDALARVQAVSFTTTDTATASLRADTSGTPNAEIRAEADNATGAVIVTPGFLRVGFNASGGGTSDGWATIGDTSRDYTPTSTTWNTGASTLLLNALTYSTIGFHDAGARVDFIRAGGGTINIGHNGGFGNANTGLGVMPTATFRLQLDLNSAAKPTSSTWTVTSDRRTKYAEVQSFDDGLATVRRLRWRRYRTNGLASQPENDEGIGLIADEAAEDCPILVKAVRMKLRETDTEETDVGTIDYHPLWGTYGNAITELADGLDAMRQSIAEITERIDAIESRSRRGNRRAD